MSDINDENFEKLIAKLGDDSEDNSPKPTVEETLVEEESEKKTQKIQEEVKKEQEEIKSEDDLQETKIKASDSDSDYPHISIITTEGIDVSQLQDEIKGMITFFNEKREQALTQEASEETFLKLKKLSVLISDKLMDWLEKDEEVEKKEEGGEVIDAPKEDSKWDVFGEDFLGGIFNW